jgi:hypothetical protein
MNLDLKTIKYIQDVVRACRLVGVDGVIIEPGIVRGMDDNRSVVVFMNEDVPDMPFGSIGLSRLAVFQSRLDIIKVQDKFTIDATIKDGTEYVQTLTMKAKGTKIDYRCMNPSNLSAPKKLNDVMMHRVKLGGDTVGMMQKAMSAMSADVVTFISNSEGVSFELVDVNKDVFKHTFTDDVEPLDDGNGTNFAYRYPIKTIISLFKEEPNGSFEVGARGLLKFTIDGVDIYVLPLA